MVPLSDPFGLAGTTLGGKYDVEAVIAETEFSIVYRATHRVWRRPAAIKAFKAGSVNESARERLLESFVREGALMMELSERSATICQARDVGSTITASGDWVPYMILEWLEGEPLDVMLARERAAGRTPRTPAEAMRLLQPIAEALALAHGRHIVHGDVKPGNVFLVADATAPRCKLLDFGIAKVLDLAANDVPDAPPGRSFTPAYAAPEQFCASVGPTGPWTDVFALALVFVELVTGHEPLPGRSFDELSAAALDPAIRPTPRTRGAAAVGDAVEAVIARALAVDPEGRHRSALDFWTALTDAAKVAKDATVAAEAERERPSLIPASGPGAAIPIRLTRRRAAPKRRWVVPGIAFVGAAASVLALQHYVGWLPVARAEAWSRIQSWPMVVVSRAVPSAHLHPAGAP